MSITTTTVSSAVAVNDTSINVASATGFAVGNFVLVDQELMLVAKSYVPASLNVPVQRGQDGSVTAAHKASANAVTFLGSDEPGPAPQGFTQFPLQRTRFVTSYSAAGAIALPLPGNDAVAILNGTSALAMTLANPTKDMDGCILSVVGNGKAAHTITYTAGLGNAGSSLDVGTFATGAQLCATFVAANGIWCSYPSLLGGTQTANTVTWA